MKANTITESWNALREAIWQDHALGNYTEEIAEHCNIPLTVVAAAIEWGQAREALPELMFGKEA